jgi:hypothetical protein
MRFGRGTSQHGSKLGPSFLAGGEQGRSTRGGDGWPFLVMHAKAMETVSMAMYDNTVATEAPPAPTAPLLLWIKSAPRRFAVWIETCSDLWAAAALYEQLSALSDAELA